MLELEWRRAEDIGKLDIRGHCRRSPIVDVVEFDRIRTALLHAALDFCGYATMQILRLTLGQAVESCVGIRRQPEPKSVAWRQQHGASTGFADHCSLRGAVRFFSRCSTMDCVRVPHSFCSLGLFRGGGRVSRNAFDSSKSGPELRIITFAWLIIMLCSRPRLASLGNSGLFSFRSTSTLNLFHGNVLAVQEEPMTAMHLLQDSLCKASLGINDLLGR